LIVRRPIGIVVDNGRRIRIVQLREGEISRLRLLESLAQVREQFGE
jgi:hypothetical protein